MQLLANQREGPLSNFDSAACTAQIFTLHDLGVDSDRLLSDILPTFEQLTWDNYDVRREQIELIRAGCPYLDTESNKRLAQYYRGTLPLQMLSPLIDRLARADRERIREITPYRRRHVTNYNCIRNGSGEWELQICRSSAVAQMVAPTDYRSIERIFPRIEESVWNHSEFQNLLQGVIRLLTKLESNAKAFSMTCWQNGVVARPERSASNSPEGIHQDGSDYIVSALVLERKNISGGASRIFGPDKQHALVEHVLLPGEGILQRDAGSPLWHDVTPVSLVDKSPGQVGIRNTLGFDINIVGR